MWFETCKYCGSACALGPGRLLSHAASCVCANPSCGKWQSWLSKAEEQERRAHMVKEFQSAAAHAVKEFRAAEVKRSVPGPYPAIRKAEAAALAREAASVSPFAFEGRAIRIEQDESGEPLFCTADVCGVLGVVNASRAVARLMPDEKGVRTVNTLGGPQAMTFVTEPGLYRLIFESRKPEAERFSRWVRHDVLPSIRKTGGYSAPVDLRDPDTLLRLLEDQAKLAKWGKERVAELEPRAASFDRFMGSKETHCLRDSSTNLGLGPGGLIRMLAEDGRIYRRLLQTGEYGEWLPASSEIESGRMVTVRKDINGAWRMQARITAAGLDFYARHYAAQKSLLS